MNKEISHGLLQTRRAHWTAAVGILLGSTLTAATALADQAPVSMTNPVIVPVYWNGISGNVTPEVETVLPSFYADFSGQLLTAAACGITTNSAYGGHDAPQDATQFLGEYGVQTISVETPYTAHVVPLAPSQLQGLWLQANDIATMLVKEIQSGGLQAPLCNPPTSGSTAYAQSLYVVHLPPGSNLSDNYTGNPNPTCTTGGWHKTFSYPEPGGQYACESPFIAVVDVSPNNGNNCDVAMATQVVANGVDFGMINAYTLELTHELAEAMVNPFGSGPVEVGDHCQTPQLAGGITNVPVPWNIFRGNSGTPWLIPSLYSRANNTCWVSEQSLYENSSNNGYVTVTNSSLSSSAWDSEAYKSSGFALGRGPTHMDVFSVKAFEGPTNAETTAWDTAYSQQHTNPRAWNLVNSSWGSPSLTSPNIGRSPESLDTGNVAPLAAPMTAVSPSPTSIFAFVAGNDQMVDMATCTTGDGCRTTGSWTQLGHIQAFNGTYQVAPSTPISALSPPGVPLTLFFAGLHGELFELQRPNLWTLTQIAPPGTVPSKAFVSAIARWEVLLKNYEYEVFFADAGGTIHLYNSTASGGGWTNSVINSGAPVAAGTQIAALTRVPGQIDIFAVDRAGAVQSFWWNELTPFAWNQVTPPIMPSGTALAGAGIAAAGWATHMEVFTTGTSSRAQQLFRQTFDECTGWLSAPSASGSAWPVGIQLQAVSRYRDSVDVFGLWSDGTVVWQGFSTQFQGLPAGTYPGGDCTASVDCSDAIVQ